MKWSYLLEKQHVAPAAHRVQISFGWRCLQTLATRASVESKHLKIEKCEDLAINMGEGLRLEYTEVIRYFSVFFFQRFGISQYTTCTFRNVRHPYDTMNYGNDEKMLTILKRRSLHSRNLLTVSFMPECKANHSKVVVSCKQSYLLGKVRPCSCSSGVIVSAQATAAW